MLLHIFTWRIERPIPKKRCRIAGSRAPGISETRVETQIRKEGKSHRSEKICAMRPPLSQRFPSRQQIFFQSVTDSVGLGRVTKTSRTFYSILFYFI
jgi:hypothetical protein